MRKPRSEWSEEEWADHFRRTDAMRRRAVERLSGAQAEAMLLSAIEQEGLDSEAQQRRFLISKTEAQAEVIHEHLSSAQDDAMWRNWLEPELWAKRHPCRAKLRGFINRLLRR